MEITLYFRLLYWYYFFKSIFNKQIRMNIDGYITEIYFYNKKGKLHRDRKPAIYRFNFKLNYVNLHYYKNDFLHRVDLPAQIIYGAFDTSYYFYLNGLPHRDNGAARYFINKCGFFKGKIEFPEYWYHGKKIQAKSDKEFEKIIKLKSFI